MVFTAKGARTYKVKFAIPTRNDGAPRTLSTGTQVRAVALDIERMVKRMISARRWAPLEVVFDGLLSLGDVYDAESVGTLDTRLAELRDADLDPLVKEWAKRANPVYVRQVRGLIPEDKRFPASRFRRKAVSEFLAGLDCADPTRNRYRAALSVFAKWLVEREILESNPVRDVSQYKERDPRTTWMTWKDAERAVRAATDPYRAIIAIIAATGMEISATLRLTAADIDVEERTVHARGSKTAWRNRVVRFEPWAARYVEAAVKHLVGAAPLFPGISEKMALERFKDAQQAAGLSGHTLHDLRHTYAVNALRKGYKATVIARQLGHKDASLVNKVYGRFIPDASDYEVPVTRLPTAQRGKND